MIDLMFGFHLQKRVCNRRSFPIGRFCGCVCRLMLLVTGRMLVGGHSACGSLSFSTRLALLRRNPMKLNVAYLSSFTCLCSPHQGNRYVSPCRGYQTSPDGFRRNSAFLYFHIVSTEMQWTLTPYNLARTFQCSTFHFDIRRPRADGRVATFSNFGSSLIQIVQPMP
jgi:hypothetical protein